MRPNVVARHELPHPKIKDVIDGCLKFEASERFTFVEIEKMFSAILQQMQDGKTSGDSFDDVDGGVDGASNAETKTKTKKAGVSSIMVQDALPKSPKRSNVKMTLNLVRSNERLHMNVKKFIKERAPSAGALQRTFSAGSLGSTIRGLSKKRISFT